jgi:hypothetical protein
LFYFFCSARVFSENAVVGKFFVRPATDATSFAVSFVDKDTSVKHMRAYNVRDLCVNFSTLTSSRAFSLFLVCFFFFYQTHSFSTKLINSNANKSNQEMKVNGSLLSVQIVMRL